MTYAKWIGKDGYASHGASGRNFPSLHSSTNIDHCLFLIVIGAIYSIIALLACVAPTMTFQLYGIIPIPAWLAVTGLFSYDLYSTISNKVRQNSNQILLYPYLSGSPLERNN